MGLDYVRNVCSLYCCGEYTWLTKLQLVHYFSVHHC
jgi:hypothetical protein